MKYIGRCICFGNANKGEQVLGVFGCVERSLVVVWVRELKGLLLRRIRHGIWLIVQWIHPLRIVELVVLLKPCLGQRVHVGQKGIGQVVCSSIVIRIAEEVLESVGLVLVKQGWA